MENSANTAHSPATKGALDALEGKLGVKIDQLLSKQTKATEQLLADQADVILDAVEERMDKKLGDKFDPVMTKLDAVLKEFQDRHTEDIAGAEQLRRHEDRLEKHQARIGKLETAATRA